MADHPANRVPYTPKEEIANKYKTPKLISANVNPEPKGITPQEIRLTIKEITGANKNKALFEWAGRTDSFTNSFNASATFTQIVVAIMSVLKM